MIPYVLIPLSIVLIATLTKGKPNKLSFCIVFLILTFFAGFRGAFTSDYEAYERLFLDANSYGSLQELINGNFYTEKGFLVIAFLFGRIANSSIAFFVFLSAITNFAVLYVLFRKSKNPWLSILLYVGIGTYYDSFNITRFILMTAILFACGQLIVDRRFWKFLLIILLLMHVHRMAIIMIPMYFLLNVKVNKKNVLTEIGLGSIIICFLPVLIQFIQIIFPKYADYSFGMDGGTWKTIVIPMGVLVFLFYYFGINRGLKFNIESNDNRLIINAFVYQIIFTLCSMRVYMATRLIFFFSPYLWLLVPNVIATLKNKAEKYIFTVVVGLLSIVYQLVVYSGTGYDPYFTIFAK